MAAARDCDFAFAQKITTSLPSGERAVMKTAESPVFFIQERSMRISLAALALVFTLPAGLALAEPQNVIPPQEAFQPGQQAQATEQSSFQAFKANVNPNVVVPTTGVYDQGDGYVGSHGFPLEGWSQVRLPNEN
jgi:hypothetical protein